jgi:hypothetical protein
MKLLTWIVSWEDATGWCLQERTRPRTCLDGPGLDSRTSGLFRNSASSTRVTCAATGQAHLDALKSVVHDDDSIVSEKSKMKCRGRDAIFPDMTGGIALCLPNHVSQLGGDCPNAVCVLSQIRQLLPLVAPDLHTRVRRGKGLRDSNRILARHLASARASRSHRGMTGFSPRSRDHGKGKRTRRSACAACSWGMQETQRHDRLVRIRGAKCHQHIV